MRAIIQPNQWESDFFQQKIGRLSFEGSAPFDPSKMADFELIQAKVLSSEQQQIDFLQRLGFQLVEGEIQFQLPVAKILPKSTACCLRQASLFDLPALRQLTDEAFEQSRFREPWFTPLARKGFYQQWIENAVTQRFDDVCWVSLTKDQQLQGVISLRKTAQEVQVGLLAVAKRYQGRGIAKALLQQGLDWTQKQHRQQLVIPTQLSNMVAINLYQRLGANITAINYWFYK